MSSLFEIFDGNHQISFVSATLHWCFSCHTFRKLVSWAPPPTFSWLRHQEERAWNGWRGTSEGDEHLAVRSYMFFFAHYGRWHWSKRPRLVLLYMAQASIFTSHHRLTKEQRVLRDTSNAWKLDVVSSRVGRWRRLLWRRRNRSEHWRRNESMRMKRCYCHRHRRCRVCRSCWRTSPCPSFTWENFVFNWSEICSCCSLPWKMKFVQKNSTDDCSSPPNQPKWMETSREQIWEIFAVGWDTTINVFKTQRICSSRLIYDANWRLDKWYWFSSRKVRRNWWMRNCNRLHKHCQSPEEREMQFHSDGADRTIRYQNIFRC